MIHYNPEKEIQVFTGDCTEILPQFPDDTFDMYIFSPPYNCRIDYGGGDDDQMPWSDYYRMMGIVISEAYRTLRPGGVIAINVPPVIRWQADHRFAHTWADYQPDYPTHRNGQKVNGRGRIEPLGIRLWEMIEAVGFLMREPITWVKGADGNAISTTYQMGSDNNPYMRPTHEWIMLASKMHWHHRGGTGRRGAEAVPFMDDTKDTWFLNGASDKYHPAVFPVEIPLRLIRLFTHAPDSVILDPFAGVGSTGQACKRLGRRFVGIERNPEHAEDCRNRLAQQYLPGLI